MLASQSNHSKGAEVVSVPVEKQLQEEDEERRGRTNDHVHAGHLEDRRIPSCTRYRIRDSARPGVYGRSMTNVT